MSPPLPRLLPALRRAALVLLTLTAWGRAVHAQQSPLASVAQPGAGPADGAEPWSVVQNPAALSGAKGWLIGLRHSELSSDSGTLGRGTGLYVAHPLPYLSSFAIGGGLEILRPAVADLPDLSGKLTLALSYQLTSTLAIGLGYAHLFASGQAPSYDGLDTASLSARLSSGRFFAAGLVLHDLPAPRPRDPLALGVERSYELELALRPLGDHRLELAAGLRAGEASHRLWPRGRLWLRPLPGLGLGAEVSLIQTPSAPLEYRIGLGVELSLAHVGASGFALFGRSIGSPAGLTLHGGSAAVRISVERYPALLRGPPEVYRLALGRRSGESMLQLLKQLRALERNRRAQGVLLLANGLTAGWGVADELRQAVLRLRAAGKRVVVYGADLSQREYYIASAAERIWVDPMGSVQLGGIGYSGLFVKEAIERLGLRAELIRIGDYKSAPEMWTRNEPSEPAKAQRQALIDDIYERLLGALCDGRRLQRAQVAQLIEQASFPAQAAQSARLVDGVTTAEQVDEQLRQLFGQSVSLAEPDSHPAHPISAAPPGVAVLRIEGDLTDGTSQKVPLLDIQRVGAQTLFTALAEIERDPKIVALVLRVDSPGGSALAADLLARRLRELNRVKPVVCSFGDVAASGGYYLAAPCSQIFTNPSTTTGSIGIFGGKVDASGLLGWLGVHRFALQRGSHADLDSPYRPYSDAERSLILARLRQGYDRFVATVAEGRHLTRPEVEQRAQGRVFSGAQAVGLRLCDRSGGLMDAVAAAQKLAGLDPSGPGDDPPLYFFPQAPPSLLGRLLGLPEGLFASADPSPFPSADLGRLLRSASALLPGIGTALLLLDSDLLMRIDSDPPR